MSEILIYTTPESQTQVEVTFEGDTVWLTQKQIVDLFQSSKANISEHVKHIFEDGELDPSQTVRNFRTVQLEGKKKVSRQIDHYNLDLILSVGYRVNSKRGTQFRQWATRKTDPKPDVQISWIKVNSNKEILPTLPCWQK